ncbi:MAG: glycosyltransferase [Firmicutes bacterium HGW-Firmicutes-12]|jgi:glycosyltransferase involved in cell wall biosynthesis|nr:MAG: glycosyltransferase [Firmicutes bacterium HGW-Firmicutes-12]
MWTAVVPAYNEENSIYHVMTNLNMPYISKIVLVTNGCTDHTQELAIKSTRKDSLHIIDFPEPLGVDIPRAIGAAYARKINSTGLIFVDGDMKGNISYAILELIQSIESGVDMALTNCYPYISNRSTLALSVLKERENLNRKLDLFDELGLASPCHGPHAISNNLLQMLPPELIAVPPLSLVFAVINNFSVRVATSIPHHLLGSHGRNNKHASLIAETIIGDCREALVYANNDDLEHSLDQEILPDGYRSKRRFDLLNNYLTNLK